MTPETEKLEDALKVQEQCGTAWHDMADDFYEKYNEHASAVIEQAARRYAEVLPLLEDIIESDLGYQALPYQKELAAIVARDEERKQSDE